MRAISLRQAPHAHPRTLSPSVRSFGRGRLADPQLHQRGPTGPAGSRPWRPERLYRQRGRSHASIEVSASFSHSSTAGPLLDARDRCPIYIGQGIWTPRWKRSYTVRDRHRLSHIAGQPGPNSLVFIPCACRQAAPANRRAPRSLAYADSAVALGLSGGALRGLNWLDGRRSHGLRSGR